MYSSISLMNYAVMCYSCNQDRGPFQCARKLTLASLQSLCHERQTMLWFLLPWLILSVLEPHVMESRACTLCLAALGQCAFELHPSCLHQASFFKNCLSFHYLNITCMSIHLLRTFGLSFGSFNKAAMHILVWVFVRTSVLSSLGKCPGMELLGWRVGICWTW